MLTLIFHLRTYACHAVLGLPYTQEVGFQTGNMVIANVPSGVKEGTHTGRVAVRATGNFNIQTPAGAVQGIS